MPKPRALKDYTGQRFGRLVAVRMIERVEKENNHRWAFACDCGAAYEGGIKSVRSGHTKSCGCLAREATSQRNQTHGLSAAHPREYRSWKDMRSRCNTETNSDYQDYGGRGIQMCGRWGDFAAFLADMGNRPEGMTIDRIDVDGDYEPGNCRWADAKTQANNKRTNHRITLHGETRNLQEWCDLYALEPSKVRYRIGQGWPIEKAFSLEDHRR